MGSVGTQPRFRRLQQIEPDYCPSKITQYESEQTGMRVIVVDQKGPKLHGFFVLATEIHDDSGAPHTLEHLCFMGSRNYKYKGFLDKLATRAYSGTNAWTATDHTAYTLETAGWAGVAQILPVYLEHVILPTLTDAGCTTEVHHIDGSGNDAGVVYSEMQGVQNTASELIELRAKRIMYPEGVGFRYETGGMLEQLRVLTADRIRDFHREMYQPKNLCVVLFGDIVHDELLNILDKFEASILQDIPDPDRPFRRPWIESKPAPPLPKTFLEKVEFPEEDESFGQVDIRFFGPNCADEVLSSAMDIVLEYLAGNSASLLDNTLVEKEQLASGVYYQTDARPRMVISFTLSGVETNRLSEVEQRFFEVLRDGMEKDLDMGYLQDCIDRQVRTAKFKAEASSTAFADFIIADYLYGRRDGSTLKDLTTLDVYTKVLSSWTQAQWKDYIKRYISDAHHISILGVPSAKLSQKQKADEATRVEQQKVQLGPQGLKEMEEKLEKAKSENDREIPSELFDDFKVPSTDSIHFVKTTSARIGPALKFGRPQNKYQKTIEADTKDMPLFIDFEHIPSNFARLYLIISTEMLPVELRPLLSIYIESFFNLPLKRGVEVVDFEQVVQEIERDTVGYTIDSGSTLDSVECLKVTFQVEIEKYHTAIKWIKELLSNSVFDIERLKAINTRLLADIPDAKRRGESMLDAVHCMVHLAPKSIARAWSTLVKALYLKRIKQLLNRDPEQVVKQFEKLRNALCKFENFRVLVVADLDKLQNPISSWNSLLEGMDTSKDLCPLGRRIERLSEAGLHPGKLAYIIPLPTIDSSFACSIARGPSSFNDPRLPAVMVAMTYMNAVEGPLWVAVRGTGLAYGTSMSYDIESGFLRLDIYRSPDAYKAFEASRSIVESHINGTASFDPLMLEGAISSIVVAFANEQQTLASAAVSSFIRNFINKLPSDYMEKTLRQIREITVDDLKKVLKETCFDIFKPGTADVLVTCAPGLKDGIKTGLTEAGFTLEIHDLDYFQDDYGLTVQSDENDEEDENDDENEDEDGEDEEDEEGEK